MIPQWLVKQNPWDVAEAQIQNGSTGDIVAINIEEIIEPANGQDSASQLVDFLQRWKNILHNFFGEIAKESTHNNEFAISSLVKYIDGPIVRLFADTAAMGCSNSLDFEIVGKKKSLVYSSSTGGLANYNFENEDGSYTGSLFRFDNIAEHLKDSGNDHPPIKLGVISLDHPHSTGNHFPALDHIQHAVSVAAIADSDRQRCEEYLNRYGATYYTSNEELLADDQIDAVLITSINCNHSADVIAAAKAGKDILCDKPIATAIEDTLAMVETVRDNNVRFLTTFPCRFHPAILKLKALIDQGKLGKIRSIMATNHGSMYAPGTPEWVLDPKRNGGGSIIDHTVHAADFMRYLTGEEFEDVQTFAESSLLGIEAEDIATTHGRMTGDILYQIDCSWSRKATDPNWGDYTARVIGTKGSASLDLYNNHKLEIYSSDGVEFRYPDLLCHQHGEIFLDYQYSKDTGKKGIGADEIDGLRTMELVFASYESVKTGQPVKVKRHSY